MALAGIDQRVDPRGKPWRMMGTDMAPQALLMSKLLLLLLLYHHILEKIGDPYLPFIPFFDVFRSTPGVFETLLLAVFVIAGVILLFNVAVRPASVLLGLVIILNILASKPEFYNHVLICGCLFLLAGLHKKDEDPWMIYFQMSIVYFGASLNKLLDPDWHSGAFMHNWLLNALDNPYYSATHTLLPPLAVAKILSYVAIAQEATMAVLFAIRRTRPAAVWMGILFHGSLFVFLRGARFGHFLEDILIAYIAFLLWPRGTLSVHLGARFEPWGKALLRLLDWDRRINLVPSVKDSKEWMRVSHPVALSNMQALRYLIRYSSGFYVLLFAFYHSVRYFIPGSIKVDIFVFVGAVLLLFFAPLPWAQLAKLIPKPKKTAAST